MIGRDSTGIIEDLLWSLGVGESINTRNKIKVKLNILTFVIQTKSGCPYPYLPVDYPVIGRHSKGIIEDYGRSRGVGESSNTRNKIKVKLNILTFVIQTKSGCPYPYLPVDYPVIGRHSKGIIEDYGRSRGVGESSNTRNKIKVKLNILTFVILTKSGSKMLTTPITQFERTARVRRRVCPKQTNLRVTRLSFNRSQLNDCSTKYDTPTQT